MHSLGYALDPEFTECDVNTNVEVMEDVDKALGFMLSKEDAVQVSMQFAWYRKGEGILFSMLTRACAPKMPSRSWWDRFGYDIPQLR